MEKAKKTKKQDDKCSTGYINLQKILSHAQRPTTKSLLRF